MNKAFVREPDQVDSRCPRCDSAGHRVGPQTLAAWVPDEARKVLAETAYFCPDSQVHVIQAGREFKILAVNDLGEDQSSSPAISNGTIYMRTFQHLWAVRKQ